MGNVVNKFDIHKFKKGNFIETAIHHCIHYVFVLQFTEGNTKAQLAVLRGYEYLVGVKYAEVLMPQSLTVLQCFYGSGIVEEGVLIEWSKKKSRSIVPKVVAENIHENAAVFLSWLKGIDQEPSDDEEEENKVKAYHTHTQCTVKALNFGWDLFRV